MFLVTGATGLLGGGALARLLARDPDASAVVVVRDLVRWNAAAARLALPATRVRPVVGDLCQPGLGLQSDVRRSIAGRVSVVLHAAGDIVFSRPLEDARATNVAGTRRVLELADEIGAERIAFVSTAFVVGRRTGVIRDGDSPADGWVNAYEQSKWEAEQLVRAAGRAWVILRPATVVCDSPAGAVSQLNAVHWALKLLHDGLISMIPGSEASTLDVVPADYVADAIAVLATDPDAGGRTLHVCAGDGALSLGELLGLTWERWRTDQAWRRRAIAPPAIVDSGTYELFERSVAATASAALSKIARAMSHFVPQLALPKRFDTARTDAVLGRSAPPARAYWPAMLDSLLATRWRTARLGAAA